TNTISSSVSVGIYYPILSVFATIEVVSGRERFFRVTCTTTGGQALKINVEGINYSSVEQLPVKAVGEPQRIGNDTYYANTRIIAGGNEGDIYQCTASNGVASDKTHATMLKVASSPIIVSLTQTSATSVIVEWSQPSGGATVTGYVVHYSHELDNMTENAPVSSSHLSVSNLCSGFIYIFSVEATSEHLSGESAAS
ncbi:hypothetical protein GBAR_LOCUS31851, partial [Geodia barretti]